jgi:hypothetical protein
VIIVTTETLGRPFLVVFAILALSFAAIKSYLSTNSFVECIVVLDGKAQHSTRPGLVTISFNALVVTFFVINLNADQDSTRSAIRVGTGRKENSCKIKGTSYRKDFNKLGDVSNAK